MKKIFNLIPLQIMGADFLCLEDLFFQHEGFKHLKEEVIKWGW